MERMQKCGELLILLAATALWLPGLRDGYFLSDDFVHLADWGLPPLGQIWPWFYSEYAGYYRPLTALFWKAEYLLWGLAPFGYQLTNLLLHAACSLLVWDIAPFLFADRQWIGLWAALLFLFLPGHIFGVLMISALTGLLCSLFCLASTSLYLRGRQGDFRCELLSLLSFLLALMTKELALCLPLVILSWEGILSFSERRFFLCRWIRIAFPYLALLAAYLLFRYALFGHLPTSPLHAAVGPLHLLVNAATYGAKLFAPWGLEELKPFFRAHPALLAALSMTGLVLASLLLWRYRHRLQADHVLCLFWISCTLLPVVRLYSPWNTYLASAGSAVLLAGLLSLKKDLEKPFLSRAKQITPALLLSLFAAYSLYHQQQWLQARLLCRSALEAIVQTAAERPGPLYLANLPAELDEVPLFVGDWALQSALHIHGQPPRVQALANAIKQEPEEHLEATIVNDQTFIMTLKAPGEFFRLETFEVLSRKVSPAINYTYGKGDVRITVQGLDHRGMPNQLKIDMGHPERLGQVMLWDGSLLTPLVPESTILP